MTSWGHRTSTNKGNGRTAWQLNGGGGGHDFVKSIPSTLYPSVRPPHHSFQSYLNCRERCFRGRRRLLPRNALLPPRILLLPHYLTALRRSRSFSFPACRFFSLVLVRSYCIAKKEAVERNGLPPSPPQDRPCICILFSFSTSRKGGLSREGGMTEFREAKTDRPQPQLNPSHITNRVDL